LIDEIAGVRFSQEADMLAQWGVLVPLKSADPIAFAGEFRGCIVWHRTIMLSIVGRNRCPSTLAVLRASTFFERLVDRSLTLCDPSAVRIRED